MERELITNRHAGNPMECRAGLALWQPERRRLTFWSGTQVPHIIRNIVAELVGLPESSVRVIAPDVGGGFGVKAGLYPEDVALCLMARALPGTPVKWVEDRGEHLLAACHARDHRYLMRAGFTRDGGLLALRADITCNAGAYSGYPWTAGIEPLMAGGLLSGPYRLANYDCTVRGVATNTAPAGPYRGVARPASVFAMESVIDSAARRWICPASRSAAATSSGPKISLTGCRPGWSTTPGSTRPAWTRRSSWPGSTSRPTARSSIGAWRRANPGSASASPATTS